MRDEAPELLPAQHCSGLGTEGDPAEEPQAAPLDFCVDCGQVTASASHL